MKKTQSPLADGVLRLLEAYRCAHAPQLAKILVPIASAPAGNTWLPAEAYRRRTGR